MRAGPRTAPWRAPRGAAVAGSLGLHAILAAWLLAPSPGERSPEPSAIQVRLVTPAAREPSDRPRPETRTAERRLRPAETRLQPEAPRDDRAADLVAPVFVDPRRRGGLVGTADCLTANRDELAAAERDRCRARLAVQARERDALPMPVDLTRRGTFAGRDLEPYLARRPRNGCKVRAAGDVAPSGQEGAAAGVACSWAF